MSLCPYCGDPLKKDNEYAYCVNGACSYIEGDNMSYKEVCVLLDEREIGNNLVEDYPLELEECPFS